MVRIFLLGLLLPLCRSWFSLHGVWHIKGHHGHIISVKEKEIVYTNKHMHVPFVYERDVLNKSVNMRLRSLWNIHPDIHASILIMNNNTACVSGTIGYRFFNVTLIR